MAKYVFIMGRANSGEGGTVLLNRAHEVLNIVMEKRASGDEIAECSGDFCGITILYRIIERLGHKRKCPGAQCI